MHLAFVPALALLLASSFDSTTASPTGDQSPRNLLTGRELKPQHDAGVRRPRYVPDFVFPTDDEDTQWHNPKKVEVDFGYLDSNGPLTWPTKFPTCGGNRQSPIDINLAHAKHPHEGTNYNLIFKSYNVSPQQMSLNNTGKSLQLTAKWNARQKPTIEGPVLNGEYAWEEIHFHWDSEHLINGESYPMEMHVLHYKQAYGSLDEARNKNDGLAVISYLFKIQEEGNPALEKLIHALKQVHDPGSPQATIPPFSLDKLARPFARNYVSYLGSLTTPPCSEIVTWIVSLHPLGVSPHQLGKLRKLRDENGNRLLRNFRPVQRLHNRVVTFVPKHNHDT